MTSPLGTNSSTSSHEFSALGTSNAGFLPSTPFAVTVTPSVECPGWTAVSSDPAFVNIVSGASGSGISTLEFNAFANTHPSDRTATITVTAGSASGTYVATELGSPDALADREVRALYQKILNREPDSGGFAFWVGVATENPDGLGMMVDNFLTTPPAYEAMNRDFMVLAIYQAILGTPGGAVSPVSYSDWSDAVNQFLSFPQLCGDRFCGWQVAGSGLVQTLLSSSTVTNELNSVVVPVCPGTGPSSAASLATMLYENTFGASPSCTKLNTLITNMVGNGYNGTDPNAAVFNFLLDNIWQPEPFSAPPGMANVAEPRVSDRKS